MSKKMIFLFLLSFKNFLLIKDDNISIIIKYLLEKMVHKYILLSILSLLTFQYSLILFVANEDLLNFLFVFNLGIVLKILIII